MSNTFTSIFSTIVTDSRFTALTTLLLIGLYSFFLYNHVIAIRLDAVTPVIAVFIVMESIVLLLLVMRQQPKAKTTDVQAWIYAFLGTFLPFALFPFNSTVVHAELGNILMLIGGVLAAGAYLSLNTSFGVSPSLRTVKTNGLYKFVRHPMYAAYVFLYGGYLLLVFSPYNAIILCSLLTCLVVRIHFEEQLLRTTDSYQAYAKKVPYRLVPFLY